MFIKSAESYTINWKDIEKSEYKGEKGTSWWKTVEIENVRMRIVEYSPGFISDHWCPRGHVIQILDGEMKIELKDSTVHILEKGMSILLGDSEENPHMASSEKGTIFFIVD
jgi:quercetin dioxygenase-like cupin family protein